MFKADSKLHCPQQTAAAIQADSCNSLSQDLPALQQPTASLWRLYSGLIFKTCVSGLTKREAQVRGPEL